MSDHKISRINPDPTGSRITSDPPVDIPRIMDPGYPSGSRITDRLGSPGGYSRVVDQGYPPGSRITDILEWSIQYPPGSRITDRLGSPGGYPRMVNPGYPPRSRVTSDPPADTLAWSRTIDPNATARQTSLLRNDQQAQDQLLSVCVNTKQTFLPP